MDVDSRFLCNAFFFAAKQCYSQAPTRRRTGLPVCQDGFGDHQVLGIGDF